MSYVDGFVAAVPTNKKDEYISHAKIAALVFKEYGALKVVEAWGDDVPDGELTSVPCQLKKKQMKQWCFLGSFGHLKK